MQPEVIRAAISERAVNATCILTDSPAHGHSHKPLFFGFDGKIVNHISKKQIFSDEWRKSKCMNFRSKIR